MDERKRAETAKDDTITAEDLKGVSAVPQDGDGKDGKGSGADATDRQGDEVDPGTG
ncbi:hypothetical protein [uncultured Methylobacterium sp.]|jgi:hypothetical protein|uniref:hypothetical protein n=1 Tax=uncultured Methylobacterium sp. TaxID=157278 RepID=UPI002613F7AA|nr:hypothetical protein [uncultured Methylobacterium sp.]